MNNFVVAGVPRSGSHFLASVLNLSPSWEVMPELNQDFGRDFRPNPKKREVWIEEVNARLQKNNYGEVTPQLLKVLSEIIVSKKVCVMRHPYDFLLSTFNRRNAYVKKFEFVFGFWYIPFYYCLDRYIREGMYYLKYEDLVSDKNVLVNLCDYLGINDLSYKEVDYTKKINSFQSHKQKNQWTFLKMLDSNQLEKLKELDWFCKRYYGITIRDRHIQLKMG